MKSVLATCLAATAAVAAPLAARDSTNIDTTVLQFALTLEHLEDVFYKEALQNYTKADFQKAGFSDAYYENLQYVASDEQSHVALLTSALKAAGQDPVAQCTYSFPSTDAKSFVTLASVIEGLGSSAYLGGAPLITSKTYLTVAGSILVTEALHTSLQRLAIGEIAAANPYGTSLDPTSVYTVAAAFIKSCPSTNAKLPFTPFPALTYDGVTKSKRDTAWQPTTASAEAPASSSHAASMQAEPMAAAAGNTISFTAAKAIPADSYLTFVSGLNVTSVKGDISGSKIMAAVPTGVSGQTYVFVSKSDQEMTFNDSAVLYGPSIVEISPPAPMLDYSY